MSASPRLMPMRERRMKRASNVVFVLTGITAVAVILLSGFHMGIPRGAGAAVVIGGGLLGLLLRHRSDPVFDFYRTEQEFEDADRD